MLHYYSLIIVIVVARHFMQQHGPNDIMTNQAMANSYITGHVYMHTCPSQSQKHILCMCMYMQLQQTCLLYKPVSCPTVMGESSCLIQLCCFYRCTQTLLVSFVYRIQSHYVLPQACIFSKCLFWQPSTFQQSQQFHSKNF